MRIEEYEKAVLSVILRNCDKDIPLRIALELDDDKFSTRQHKLIYRAMQDLVVEGRVPEVVNVVMQLGNDADIAGGEAYLQSLVGYLPLLGVIDPGAWEDYIRFVDSAGRLRHLGLVVDEYAKRYEDLDHLANEVDDVDAFLVNFMRDVNKAQGAVRSTYKPISVAGEEDLQRLEMEAQGLRVDLIPTGWPSLEAYAIPRPQTLGVIAGITSMGKTQFALLLMLGAAINLYENNLPGVVAINELETVGWRLNRRMACAMAGIDSNVIAQGRLTPELEGKYRNAVEYIASLPIYYEDKADLTSTEFAYQALAMHVEHGKRVLGIADYIELFADTDPNEERRVANLIRGHRRIAWETGSSEIAISQFNNSVMQTQSKIGGSLRTRYSGAIGHASDWFIEVYNPKQMLKANIEFEVPAGMRPDVAYALVHKNKDYPIGNVTFDWEPTFTRFKDVAVPRHHALFVPTQAGVANGEEFDF